MKENDTQEVDLRDIFRILCKRIKLIIFIPLLAVMLSAVFSYYYLTPAYQASTTMMLWKEYSGEIEIRDLQINRQLVNTYREIAKSRLVAEKTIKELNMDLTIGQLINKVDVSLVGDTEIISISVTDGNPENAAIIANKVAEVFQEQVPLMINMDNIRIIDEAIPNYSPISPRPRLNMAVAGILGFIMAMGLAIFLEYIDDTIKTPEELQWLLELNVLGTIPMVDKISED